MLIAHHIILTGYAHWLPNDPRGSKSRELRKEELGELGDIHYGRKRMQPPLGELRAFYKQAKERLDHPTLWFEEQHRQTIGETFGEVIAKVGLTCYACAVLRNHAHLLVRKHKLTGEQMSRELKSASRQAILAASLAPPEHPVWSENDCTMFKNSVEAVHGAVEYIWGNFGKHRIAPQHWRFQVPYDNWPMHKKRI